MQVGSTCAVFSSRQWKSSVLVAGWSSLWLFFNSCILRLKKINKKSTTVLGFYWKARRARSSLVAPWVRGFKKLRVDVEMVFFLEWETLFFSF